MYRWIFFVHDCHELHVITRINHDHALPQLTELYVKPNSFISTILCSSSAKMRKRAELMRDPGLSCSKRSGLKTTMMHEVYINRLG